MSGEYRLRSEERMNKPTDRADAARADAARADADHARRAGADHTQAGADHGWLRSRGLGGWANALR